MFELGEGFWFERRVPYDVVEAGPQQSFLPHVYDAWWYVVLAAAPVHDEPAAP